jgi:hypothetical protein
MKTYTWTDGRSWNYLPNPFNNTSPVTEQWWTAHGGTITEIPDPTPEPQPVRYSKYKIQLACQARSLWDDVKAAIAAANLQDSWANIQDISSDNPELQAALPAIREHFGSDLVDEVLAESIAD